jgi:chromosome segregation ATPase
MSESVEKILKNLSNLQAEEKALSKRIALREKELDDKVKEVTDFVKETEKRMAKEESDFNKRYSLIEANMNKKLSELAQREKDIETKEGEQKRIEKDWNDLKEAQKAFKSMQEDVDRAMGLAVEKEKKADLLIEQYNKKLSELPK